MLISYTFAYIYLVMSLGCLVKDLFSNSICKIKLNDRNIIGDIRVALPLVRANLYSLLKVLFVMDIYFFVFGSSYNIIASLLYFMVGVPVMFLVNSVLSMNSETYLQSRYLYNKECEITTLNPTFILFCDENMVIRLKYLMGFMAIFFGRNEYLVLSYLMVPYCMALVTQLNVDFTKLDEKYDLDMITENEQVNKVYVQFMKYENFTLNNVIRIKNLYKVANQYLPSLSFLNNNNSKELNELGGVETYDTIPEVNDGILMNKRLNDVNTDENEDNTDENEDNTDDNTANTDDNTDNTDDNDSTDNNTLSKSGSGGGVEFEASDENQKEMTPSFENDLPEPNLEIKKII